MATFPVLRPAARSSAPGSPPSTEYRSLRGGRDVVQHSNAKLDGRLELPFEALSMAEMTAILDHYREQQGSFLPFQLPAEVFDGLDPAQFNLSGYGWQYTDTPDVEEFPENVNRIRYNVRVQLEPVPVRWMAAPGASIRILYTLTGGAATGAIAASGAALRIGYSIDGGEATEAQLSETPAVDLTVSYSLSGGAAGPYP